ncbi:MAG: transglycosylase domain-containing protein, partial [Bacteroidota bacterium]
VSKERMLEVYLNIIEWGPDVYGIGEASRFYFDKAPVQLTLEESIFLASIVPSPKAFRYRFDSNGQLKPHLGGFYKQVVGRMVRKEMIPQELADGIQPAIRLIGPAAQLVQPIDTIAADTASWLPELPVQN